MQGRRHKIKRIFFIIGFILFTIGVGLYERRELIFTEFRQFIENTISRQLHAKVKIGKFEGGFLNKISFRDLSISDEESNFQIIAEHAHFNFRISDILLKKYRYLKQISLVVENVGLFKQGFHLPIRISEAKAYFAKGLLRIEDLRGYLDGKIPFEIKATVARILEQNPEIEISCRFLSGPIYKKIPLSLPAVIYLSGDLNKILLKGYWDEPDRAIFDIEGYIQPLNRLFAFTLSPRERFAKWIEPYIPENTERSTSSVEMFRHTPQIALTGDFTSPNRLNIKLGLQHLSLHNNDFLSNVFIETKFIPEQNLVQGRIYSSGSILNYQPLPEFLGFFKIKERRLRISSFKWSDALLLSGLINFRDPISGNLLVLLNNFNIEPLAKIYYPQWNSWGLIQGRINLDIKSPQLTTKGDINFSKGLLGPFQFKGGRILIEGENNILRLINSRVYQEDGYFDLVGELDLKKLGQLDFAKKLVMNRNQTKMEWQGWNISRRDGVSGIVIDKGIDEKFSVGFRTYMNNEEKLQSDRRDGEFDLEYRLEGDDSLKIRLRENEELLGLERKIKF